MIGIGTAMGISEGWIAGAIISGAYFGDKLSPLSDTTNLAPAVAGTDLITHIRYMTITTVPSILIALAVFLIVGFTVDPSPETAAFAEGLGEAIYEIGVTDSGILAGLNEEDLKNSLENLKFIINRKFFPSDIFNILSEIKTVDEIL